MAGQSGRNLFFELDNAAGSPQDLSEEITSVDESTEIGLEDSTTFSATRTAKSNTVTLTEGGFSIKGHFSALLNTHLKNVKLGLSAGGSLSFVLGPTGDTNGMEKISGECFMKSMKRAGEVAGLVVMEAEFVYDGTIDEGVFSS